jgi:hypothetical protein
MSNTITNANCWSVGTPAGCQWQLPGAKTDETATSGRGRYAAATPQLAELTRGPHAAAPAAR